MGITISSKRHSCDMGYAGFNRFRNTVAEKTYKDFYEHYLLLSSLRAMVGFGDERKKYFEIYDAKTKDYIENGKVTVEIANFLYQSDCSGKIDKKQALQIYKLIKDCDDGIVFGYTGRQDCAKMLDMKKIFKDMTNVKWR